MSVHLSRVLLFSFVGVGTWAGFSAVAAGSPTATLLFGTKLPGVVEARVERVVVGPAGAGRVPLDRRFVGQSQVVGAGGRITAIGEPVPFNDTVSDALGCVTDGGVVEVPAVAPGDRVQVRLVAWLRAYGATYEEAARLNLGLTGVGEATTVYVGGGALLPGLLTGMTGFQLKPGVGGEPGATWTSPARWVANGHRYQALEAPGLTWAQARVAAESHTAAGVRGHLVTPTSSEENAFLAAHSQLGANQGRLLEHWIGAYHPAGDSDVMKGWRWVTDDLFNDSTWYLDVPLPTGAADYSAYFRVARRGPTGLDWGFVADASGATKPGYVVEYDTPPEGSAGGLPGPMEVHYVVVGLTSVKALVSWPPEAGVSLQRSSLATPGVWEAVPFSEGTGAYLELSWMHPSTIFRLDRKP